MNIGTGLILSLDAAMFHRLRGFRAESPSKFKRENDHHANVAHFSELR
jgi:hypothetical protein